MRAWAKVPIWGLTVFLLLFFLGTCALAENVSGNYAYRLNEENQAIVTRYLGKEKSITMNWHLDHHVIVEIGEEAFAGNGAVEEIVLPAGIRMIRTNAFQDCTALRSVQLPQLLETVEDGAFWGCTALEKITIPPSVMELGENCFDPATTLLGDEDSLAAGYAASAGMDYAYQSQMQEMDTPSDETQHFSWEADGDGIMITAYYGEAFHLTVPAAIDGKPVVKIGKNAFSSCYSLQTVTLPEGLVELDENAFRGCMEMYSITLQSTLKKIGSNCFYRCELLESVSIPAGVAELGDRAFTKCIGLRDVTMTDGTEKIPNYTFFECHRDLTIHAPEGSAAQRHALSRGYHFVTTEE